MEIFLTILASGVVSALFSYLTYDHLNVKFKADQTSKDSHLMAVSNRMTDLEKAQSKVFLSIGQELKTFSQKLEAISESNGQMMKTMLDAEAKYNDSRTYELKRLRDDLAKAQEAEQDELFALKSTLESLGETVASLNKKKRKKPGKRK